MSRVGTVRQAADRGVPRPTHHGSGADWEAPFHSPARVAELGDDGTKAGEERTQGMVQDQEVPAAAAGPGDHE